LPLSFPLVSDAAAGWIQKPDFLCRAGGGEVPRLHHHPYGWRPSSWGTASSDARFSDRDRDRWNWWWRRSGTRCLKRILGVLQMFFKPAGWWEQLVGAPW